LVLVSICLALQVIDDASPALKQNVIEYVNNMRVNWKAGSQVGTFLDGATIAQAKQLLGAKLGGPTLPKLTYAGSNIEVPDSFDSRTNWPQCTTMKVIRDQSACGSCWAFGAAEAMSDRYCIFLNQQLNVSSGDIAFCCGFNCGDGCGGGYPSAAWQYWQSTGVVSENCDPYPFPSCDHHIPNSPHPCPSQEYPNAPCPNTCKDTETWSSAKHFGSSVYSLSGEADIQAEIMKNGPVETAFSVYEDFLTYKSGVYKHVTGGFLGGHAVKFLGWGVENGENYWLVANSWNADWGDHGYFKILRGVDECGIEGEVNGGIPKN